MNPKELKETLRLHAAWLENPSTGTFADLRNTILNGANLSGANLRNTILNGADLCDANLRGANLINADLSGANLPHFQLCPETDLFVAFKKGRGGEIIKLLIPANAKRTSSLAGRKCRAEFAVVLSITSAQGRELRRCASHHNPTFDYTVGGTVYPDSYDDDIRTECAPGIHFFITRKEAEEY